jgi:hypothetical protein
MPSCWKIWTVLFALLGGPHVVTIAHAFLGHSAITRPDAKDAFFPPAVSIAPPWHDVGRAFGQGRKLSFPMARHARQSYAR